MLVELERWRDQLYSVWSSNPELVIVLLLLTVCGMSIAWGLRELSRVREMQYIGDYIPHVKHRRLMRERKKFVDSLIASDIHQALEKRVWDQTLTRFEVNKKYRDLGIRTSNREIFPRLRELKAAYQKKRENHKDVDRIAKAKKEHGIKTGNVIRPAFGASSRRRQGKG